MEPAAPPGAAEFKIDIDRAMADPTHPAHSAFKTDPAQWAGYLKTQADRVWGDRTVVISPNGPVAPDTHDDTGAPTHQAQHAGPSPELDQPDAGVSPAAWEQQVQAKFRTEWGSDYEAKWSRAVSFGRELAEADPTLYTQLAQRLGDEVGIRALERLARHVGR